MFKMWQCYWCNHTVFEEPDKAECPKCNSAVYKTCVFYCISKEEYKQLKEGLAFARNVILSGEKWSKQCDDIINKPLGLGAEQ